LGKLTYLLNWDWFSGDENSCKERGCTPFQSEEEKSGPLSACAVFCFVLFYCAAKDLEKSKIPTCHSSNLPGALQIREPNFRELKGRKGIRTQRRKGSECTHRFSE
jgi:hypothetical protein